MKVWSVAYGPIIIVPGITRGKEAVMNHPGKVLDFFCSQCQVLSVSISLTLNQIQYYTLCAKVPWELKEIGKLTQLACLWTLGGRQWTGKFLTERPQLAGGLKSRASLLWGYCTTVSHIWNLSLKKLWFYTQRLKSWTFDLIVSALSIICKWLDFVFALPSFDCRQTVYELLMMFVAQSKLLNLVGFLTKDDKQMVASC